MTKNKLALVSEIKAEKEEHQTPWGKVWTHGADVMTTWKRFGFKPPSEYRNDYRFKTNREGGDEHV
jgi:hypothetical protein